MGIPSMAPGATGASTAGHRVAPGWAKFYHTPEYVTIITIIVLLETFYAMVIFSCNVCLFVCLNTPDPSLGPGGS